jgi:hypothetical protein
MSDSGASPHVQAAQQEQNVTAETTVKVSNVFNALYSVHTRDASSH